MSVAKKKGPVFDPGLCRCCGQMKKCRVLNVEYEYSGQKEVYSDMILDCFGLILTHLDTKVTDRLICATCVTRLRDVSLFKKQVLQCEQAFMEMKELDTGAKLDMEVEIAPKTSQHPASVGTATRCEVEIVEMMKTEPDDMDDGLDHSDGDLDRHVDNVDNIKSELLPSLSDNSDGEDVPLNSLAKKSRHCTTYWWMEKQHSSKMTDNLKLTENLDNSDCEDIPLKSIAKKKIKGSVRDWWMKKHEPNNAMVPQESGVTNHPRLKSHVDNMQNFWMKQATADKPKTPISKIQQTIRERDQSYMVESNLLTIIENSYVCPFKCRHSNLICYYCGTTFLDPKLLRDHTSEHKPKSIKITDYKKTIKVDLTRIDCRLCTTKIKDLEIFKKHIFQVHKKKFYFDCNIPLLPFKLDKDEYKCIVCFICFPYFHALNKHMNEHYSNYICETCGLGFVDSNRFMAHLSKHEEGVSKYPCETCGKLFKSAMYRDMHVDRVHKKRGRVYCPKCDATLMSHPQKVKHLIEVHGEQPQSLPCSHCDKIFETRRMLTIHWRKEHIKDFRYECHMCGQKFFTRFALTNHMPTHTGERNFKCKVCQKTYPRLKTLKEHMRIHTNDRRYRCHICGQAFIQNCSLKGHMKSQHPEYG